MNFILMKHERRVPQLPPLYRPPIQAQKPPKTTTCKKQELLQHSTTIPYLSRAATANGPAQSSSTRTSCCAEKTEYCNVPEPARRSLVQRKQTNNGIGSDAATATPASSTLHPQPTYAVGAAAIVGSEARRGGAQASQEK